MNTHTRGYVGNAIAELPNSALILLWAGITIGFAFIYFIIGLIAPEHGPTINHTYPLLEQFFDCLYFSIVTATSVGFGDIVPQGFSKFLVSLQAIASLSTFAILVTKLVSQKQEHLTENLYRMTSEETAHIILDELHLVRQDLDTLLAHLAHAHELIDPEWHDFEVAVARTQAAFLDIPKLYAREEIGMISERRENLLLEGVERTLVRLQQFLHALNTHHLPLPSHITPVIHALFTQTKNLIADWQQSIRKKHQPDIENLDQILQKIATNIHR